MLIEHTILEWIKEENQKKLVGLTPLQRCYVQFIQKCMNYELMLLCVCLCTMLILFSGFIFVPWADIGLAQVSDWIIASIFLGITLIGSLPIAWILCTLSSWDEYGLPTTLYQIPIFFTADDSLLLKIAQLKIPKKYFNAISDYIQQDGYITIAELMLVEATMAKDKQREIIDNDRLQGIKSKGARAIFLNTDSKCYR